MPERPSIKKPIPIATPELQQSADPVMGGINIPKFSAEIQSEVSPEAAPLWNFVTTHIRAISAAIIAIVVIITVIAGWQWYREKQLAAAKAELGRVVTIQDPAKRLSSLESFIANAPSKLKLSALLEIAATSLAVENWDKALNAYQQISQTASSAPLAFSARVNHAGTLMRKGDHKAARAGFLSLAASAPAEIKSSFYQQAAEAAELGGSKTEAIADYEQAIAALPPTDQQSAAFFRGRIEQIKKQ